MPASLLKKATIYPQQHRSGNVTWIVNVGKKINGKADLQRFKNKEDAEAYQNEWNLKSVQNATPDLADLQGVARHEILAAVGKLKLVNATLAEAVDFFSVSGVRHGARCQLSRLSRHFWRRSNGRNVQTSIRPA